MTLQDAVQYLLWRKFPPDVDAAMAAKARGEKIQPSPEQVAYRAELEALAPPELLDMVDASEQSRHPHEQVKFLLRQAFEIQPWRTKPPSPRKPAIDAYRDKLQAMDPEALAKHRADVLRGRGPTDRELDEAGYFFNLPTARADLKQWALEPLWKAGEAVALSFGREPSLVTWAAVKPYAGGSEFADEFLKRTDRFARAIEAGDIATKMRPFQFIVWGRQWGVSFPDELQAAVPFPAAAAPAPTPAPSIDSPAESPSTLGTTIPPATPTQLASYFRHPSDGGALHDEDGWKALAEDARANGLIAAEAERPSGRAPRKFDVEKVAAWLISKRGQSEASTAHGVLRAIPPGSEFDAVRDHWDGRAAIRTNGRLVR